MSEYPIEGLMNTAMSSIKEMVDVNTIIGEPIETNSNVVIIPVSKVNFGFAAGGSEFDCKGKKIDNKNKEEKSENEKSRMPFGGGSGAGVSISPIAFIVVQPTGVKLLPVEHSSSLDKLLDLVPDLIDKANRVIEKQLNKMNKKDEVEYYKNEVKSKNNGNTTTSEVIKKEAKPYDFEFDETNDM